MKWSSPQGSKEQYSLPRFLEPPWPGDRVGPQKQREGSLGLAKAPDCSRVLLVPPNSLLPVWVLKSGPVQQYLTYPETTHLIRAES